MICSRCQGLGAVTPAAGADGYVGQPVACAACGGTGQRAVDRELEAELERAGVRPAVPPNWELLRLHAEAGWCGPVAIAALLGLDMAAVQRALRNDFARGFMNVGQVQAGLELLGFRGLLHRGRPETDPAGTQRRWPRIGLGFIQFTGPWMEAGFDEQYKHTHWIAVVGPDVFDANNDPPVWLDKRSWERGPLASLLEQHLKGDGGWFCRSALEVARLAAEASLFATQAGLGVSGG